MNDESWQPVAGGSSTSRSQLTINEYWSFIFRTGGLLLLLIMTLLVIDLVLYVISSVYGIRLDPAAWGTYAAWASAIFPVVGILATYTIWHLGQREQRLREAAYVAALVEIESHDGAAPALVNNSSSPIWMTASQQQEMDLPSAVPAGKRKVLPLDVTQVDIEVGGLRFRLGAGGRCDRLAKTRSRGGASPMSAVNS